MIFSCISTVNYNIFVNGSQIEYFNLRRDLRHGDPLSPYLFILCADVFSRLIEREKAIQGIKICNQALDISHIFFADDILFMCRANKTNVVAITRIIEQLCKGLVQLVNRNKSHVLFSKNTTTRTRSVIKSTLGLKDLKEGALYLGNNLIFGRNITKELGRLKEKVQNRIEGWQAQLLSKVGKVTLIKSVIQVIPIYTFSIFRVPLSLCKALDSLARKFWWSN